MDDNLVKRMTALMRRMTGPMQSGVHYVTQAEQWKAEAAAIISELPNPDLVTARIIANEVEASRRTSDNDMMPDYLGGHYDDTKLVHGILKGIQRAKAMHND